MLATGAANLGFIRLKVKARPKAKYGVIYASGYYFAKNMFINSINLSPWLQRVNCNLGFADLMS